MARDMDAAFSPFTADEIGTGKPTTGFPPEAQGRPGAALVETLTVTERVGAVIVGGALTAVGTTAMILGNCHAKGPGALAIVIGLVMGTCALTAKTASPDGP